MSTGAGPVTTVVLTAAAVIGAGMVIGGFVAGVLGMLLAWDHEREGNRVARAGYHGGVVALAVCSIDLTVA